MVFLSLRNLVLCQAVEMFIVSNDKGNMLVFTIVILNIYVIDRYI